jgi:hypothetical protein
LGRTSVSDLDLTHHALVFRITAPDTVLWLTLPLRQDGYYLEDAARDDRAHRLEEAFRRVCRMSDCSDHPHEIANLEQRL